MNTRIRFTILIVLLSLIITNFLSAQPYGKKFERIYNPATVESLEGIVINVETIRLNPESKYGGVHLKLRTEKEEILVHVGPSWFLENNNFKIEINDTIELAGSRVTYDGETFIIAKYMKIGDKTIPLRDDDGKPLWSGKSYN